MRRWPWKVLDFQGRKLGSVSREHVGVGEAFQELIWIPASLERRMVTNIAKYL